MAVANRRGPDSITEQVARLGNAARAATVDEAAAFGEVVIVAIPFHAFRNLPAARLAGSIVVDAMNHYPTATATCPSSTPGPRRRARWWPSTLSGSRVVKAFNTIWYQRLLTEGRPAGDPERLALPIAGDDAEAKAVVSGLIDEMGFDAVDAGPLAAGARQQPGAPVYNAPLTAEGVRAALA